MCRKVFLATTDNFYANKYKYNGLSTYCRKCSRDYGKKYYESNKKPAKFKYRRTINGRPTKLFVVYCEMKSRCENPNHEKYHMYGGRGIFVCSTWKSNYDNFADWAYANDYYESENRARTVERLDNDGPYSPENCTFVRIQEQSRNRRNTIFVKLPDGTSKALYLYKPDCNKAGITYDTFAARIKRGWSVEDALNTPLQRQRKKTCQ